MKIKDFCTFAPKSKIKAGQAIKDGQYMFFTSSKDENKRYIDYLYDGEGIIMGTGGNATLHYYKGKYAVSTDCVVLNPDERIRCKYLYYFFLANMAILEAGFKGAGLKHTNRKYIENIVVSKLPTFDEQDSVIKILDKISDIIRFRNLELKVFDNLIKARFVEMFGDLANPETKWEKCKLVEACVYKDDIKCGPFGTQLSKSEYLPSGVAVWEIPQINSAFKIKPTDFITEAKAKELSSYSIISGDIAMSRKGNVGMCAIFPDEYSPGIIHSDVLRIRVNKKMVNPIFMLCQLHFSGAIRHQINIVSNGAVMAGINVTKLKDIEVYVPPLDLQQRYSEFYRQVDKSKVAIQKSLDETQLLFDSLMQKYFK